MNRPDRRHEWEQLLKEPVAAVAKVRFTKDQIGAVGPFSRGTAVLTESRLLVFGGGTPFRTPRTEQKLHDYLRLEFPRTNITEVELSEERKNVFIIRYVDGKEKKISFLSGSDGNALMKLMEQDLSRG